MSDIDVGVPDGVGPFDEDFPTDGLLSGSFLDANKAKEKFEVDFTGVQTGYLVVPPGFYPAVVTELEKGIAKSGKPMWIWDFTIVGEDQHAVQVKAWTSLQPQALFKLLGFLEALGLAEADKMSQFTYEEIIGRPCILEITNDKDDKGKDRHSVDNLHAADEETERLAAQYMATRHASPSMA